MTTSTPEIPTPPLPAAEVSTFREVAAAFGVSMRQTTRWRALGCQALNSRPYNLGAIARWLDDREASRTMGRPSPTTTGSADLAELRRRKIEVEITRIELDGRIRAVQAQILEDAYFPRQAVEEMFVERTRALRAGLDLVELAAATEIVGLVRDGRLESHEVSAAIRRELDHLYQAFTSDDFFAQLEERRRQVEAGVRVGGGRGRRVGS